MLKNYFYFFTQKMLYIGSYILTVHIVCNKDEIVQEVHTFTLKSSLSHSPYVMYIIYILYKKEFKIERFLVIIIYVSNKHIFV